MIYIYRGKDEVLLDEQFLNPVNGSVTVFIWKNLSGEIGFEINGMSFVEALLRDTETI